jgi:hypothetical protein
MDTYADDLAMLVEKLGFSLKPKRLISRVWEKASAS